MQVIEGVCVELGDMGGIYEKGVLVVVEGSVEHSVGLGTQIWHKKGQHGKQAGVDLSR